MSEEGDERLLDNPVWHALHGPLSRFADPEAQSALRLRFDPGVSLFSAVERIDEAVWARLGEQAEPESFCALFRDEIPAPRQGWQELFRGPCLQMLAGDLPDPSRADVVRLEPADAPEMLALAELTEPGPFLLRTPELGRYVGIRRDGRLLAMAGERFRLPGYVEISAVCTHPDARGEGLAGELTLDVARWIRRGGDVPFLHVLEENENAIRLYRKLGFAVRRRIEVVFAQWHGADWRG